MIKYPLEDKEELEKSIIAETNDFLNILKRDLRPNTRFFATISSNNSANAAKSDEKKNKRKSKLINKVDDGGELTNKGKRKKPDTTVEKNKNSLGTSSITQFLFYAKNHRKCIGSRTKSGRAKNSVALFFKDIGNVTEFYQHYKK
nr:8817_t:CDS:2 [Entrophospora candida]